MFEYLASLGGVEHGAGDPEFGCAGYHGQQFGAVFKEDRNGIPFGKPLVLQVAGDAVSPAIQFAPCDRAVFKQNGGPAAQVPGVVLDECAERKLTVLVFQGIVIQPPGYGRQAPEDSGQAAGNVQCGYVVLAHGVSIGPFYCVDVEPGTTHASGSVQKQVRHQGLIARLIPVMLEVGDTVLP